MSQPTTMTEGQATDYDKKQDEEIKKLKDKVFGGTDPMPEGCGPDPDPNHEHIKEGGWGGDMASPATWESVPMTDSPGKFKVVDKAGVNIAHNFNTEADADVWIKYHQCIAEAGNTDPTPTPVPPPVPAPVPPPSVTPTGTEAPYAIKATPLNNTIKGPLTRHYASGKPDDCTIEANVKNIVWDNYQFVVDISSAAMEHNDNYSLKYGGTHMGTGWFDQSVEIYTGATGLGYEPHHPETHLFVVKGPKIGDLRGKRVRVAGIYFKKINKCELWTDIGAGWKKQVEGTNVGGFNPKSNINEAQLRIDGFKDMNKPPTIHSAKVYDLVQQG